MPTDEQLRAFSERLDRLIRCVVEANSGTAKTIDTALQERVEKLANILSRLSEPSAAVCDLLELFGADRSLTRKALWIVRNKHANPPNPPLLSVVRANVDFPQRGSRIPMPYISDIYGTEHILLYLGYGRGAAVVPNDNSWVLVEIKDGLGWGRKPATESDVKLVLDLLASLPVGWEDKAIEQLQW